MGGPADPPRLELEALEVLDEDGDFDGIQLGDIDGDGEPEILASNGVGGAVYWYDRRQEAGLEQPEWSRWLISRGHGEIEGNDLADYDGDGTLEAISLDQRRGEILLHKPGPDGPQARWQTAVLRRGRPFLQDSVSIDLTGNGRPELIYTWEGSGPEEGGVHALRFTGSDVLDPGHWRDSLLTTHGGAWWLVPRLLDLTGRGRPGDLVFTARATMRRNALAEPGLFWLAGPRAGRLGQPWIKHELDRSIPHPLHVDAGNLAGDAEERDLVVGDFDGSGVYVYPYREGFHRHRLSNPGGTGRIFNTQVARIVDQAPQEILVAVAHAGVYLYRWRGGEYRAELLFPVAGHPLDDRVLWWDLDDDGLREAFIPDSGGMRLIMLRFRRAGSGPRRAAGRAGR